jgi:hypothetical protein
MQDSSTVGCKLVKSLQQFNAEYHSGGSMQQHSLRRCIARSVSRSIRLGFNRLSPSTPPDITDDLLQVQYVVGRCVPATYRTLKYLLTFSCSDPKLFWWARQSHSHRTAEYDASDVFRCIFYPSDLLRLQSHRLEVMFS